jgi:hypothetical protein
VKVKITTFSDYQNKDMVWAFYLDRYATILGGLFIFIVALGGVFESLTLYHYLAVLLYGLSLYLLDVGVRNN